MDRAALIVCLSCLIVVVCVSIVSGSLYLISQSARNETPSPPTLPGTISQEWIVTQSDACVAWTELNNTDFTAGTYRITDPGCYRLTEDIVFHPDTDDFRVPTGDPRYQGHAYVLGFFAGITVETTGVTLDLNTFSLRQSPAHALDQRFWAGIELGPSPFLPGQGPATFSTSFTPPSHVIIRNGHIGRSAHHGIHGNGAHHVCITDMTFRDYEVAAIACNGCSDVTVARVHVQGTHTDIPVLGTYSVARFLLPFLDMAGPAVAAERAALVSVMETAKRDILASGYIDPAHADAYRTFANPSGHLDGNAYGILFNKAGVAVNGFAAAGDIEPGHILLQDVTIDDTVADIVEVVAFVVGGHTLIGPAGDRLRAATTSAHAPGIIGPDGTYVGTVVSNAQLELMANPPSHAGTLTTNTTIVSALRNWQAGTSTIDEIVSQLDMTFARNGDTMFHVNKGAIGLRLDGVSYTTLRNVTVNRTRNMGLPGIHTTIPGEREDPAYMCGKDGGHPAQAPQYGYMGADARGVSIAHASYVTGDVRVTETTSAYAWARGIDVMNTARAVTLRARVDVVDTCAESSEAVFGRKSAEAAGIVHDASCVSVNIAGSITRISAPWTGAAELESTQPVPGPAALDVGNSYTM